MYNVKGVCVCIYSLCNEHRTVRIFNPESIQLYYAQKPKTTSQKLSKVKLSMSVHYDLKWPLKSQWKKKILWIKGTKITWQKKQTKIILSFCDKSTLNDLTNHLRQWNTLKSLPSLIITLISSVPYNSPSTLETLFPLPLNLTSRYMIIKEDTLEWRRILCTDQKLSRQTH